MSLLQSALFFSFNFEFLKYSFIAWSYNFRINLKFHVILIFMNALCTLKSISVCMHAYVPILWGIVSLLSCGFTILNSDRQAWLKMPVFTEPSDLLLCTFLQDIFF